MAMERMSETVGVRERLETIRSRGMQKAQQMKTKAQTSMKTSPGKWAAIAAGAGLGLGLLGRVVRSKKARSMPTLVFIETFC
jgi:hypothetical protein